MSLTCFPSANFIVIYNGANIQVDVSQLDKNTFTKCKWAPTKFTTWLTNLRTRNSIDAEYRIFRNRYEVFIKFIWLQNRKETFYPSV